MSNTISKGIPPEHIVASKELIGKWGVDMVEHMKKFGDTPHIRGFAAYILAIHRGEI